MGKLPLFQTSTSLAGTERGKNTGATSTKGTEVVAVFQDPKKKMIPPQGEYSEFITRLNKSDNFDAKLASMYFIRFAGLDLEKSVLLVGLGDGAEITDEKLRVAGGQTWAKLVSEKVTTAYIHVESFFEIMSVQSEVRYSRWIRAFAEGIILNAYQFKKYKSKSNSSEATYGPTRILWIVSDESLKAQIDAELAQVLAIGKAVQITRDWSNEPSNFGTPIFYAQEAKKLAREYGVKCRVLTEKEAAQEKMGLFLGVGQGSEREGRVVVLEYEPKGYPKSASKKTKAGQKNLKTISFVGKGVTFDSGGISIKPSSRMEDMKHDMTGAATVLGATLLAASWGSPHRIVSILAFTENMPSGNAIQPGNVLTSRNGKTVEIINTDAEGRLILADALDLAQDFNPDVIIDVATLTGAVSIALGKLCCGLLGNDENVINDIRRASEVTGERLWQLPLYDEYFEDLKSDCADMKNAANDSYGGTIRGAIFLKQFIKKGIRWAHLDIAGTAYNIGHLSYIPKKGASGAFVRTLAQFAMDF